MDDKIKTYDSMTPEEQDEFHRRGEERLKEIDANLKEIEELKKVEVLNYLALGLRPSAISTYQELFDCSFEEAYKGVNELARKKGYEIPKPTIGKLKETNNNLKHTIIAFLTIIIAFIIAVMII